MLAIWTCHREALRHFAEKVLVLHLIKKEMYSEFGKNESSHCKIVKKEKEVYASLLRERPNLHNFITYVIVIVLICYMM